MYGAVTWRDPDGHAYQATAHADKTKHAEQNLMQEMRQQVANRRGVSADQVDLASMSGVRMFVEYSPCDTAPRRCQEDLANSLPQAQVAYSWPWNPRDARPQSRQEASTAIASLFRKGEAGQL